MDGVRRRDEESSNPSTGGPKNSNCLEAPLSYLYSRRKGVSTRGGEAVRVFDQFAWRIPLTHTSMADLISTPSASDPKPPFSPPPVSCGVIGSVEASDGTPVSELKLGRPEDRSEFELELAKDRSLDNNFLALSVESCRSWQISSISSTYVKERETSDQPPRAPALSRPGSGESVESRKTWNSRSHRRKLNTVPVGYDPEWSPRSAQAQGSTRT